MAEVSGVPSASSTLASLAESLERELEGLERELAEIGILVGQARTEAGRHEQKRSQAAERLAALGTRAGAEELAEANAQLITLTKRAAVMESQLDVLAGKQKTLERYRDSLGRLRATPAEPGDPGGAGVPSALHAPAPPVTATPTSGRAVLEAQEDLRRDLARAIHDGPVQSLANIVLQAQIVDRLLERDPEAARAEVRDLVAMVQRTLEVTKAFVFDVRPMVLDDLGLVPTLRRVARDRSRRSQVPVEFESLGTDRRLPMELESAIFRVADEAVAGLLGGRPEKVVLVLDWGDELEVTARALHAPAPDADEAPRADMPEALREMVNDQRAQAAASGRIAVVTLAIRREIGDRVAAIGGRVEFAEDGRGLAARFPLPAARPDA